VEVRTDDRNGSWCLSSETTVRQSDFGIKPYSQLLGSLKVADDVTVSFTAECAKKF
jgi:polyisoprenoid-binding protein YceI